jgi:hypothetical protein
LFTRFYFVFYGIGKKVEYKFNNYLILVEQVQILTDLNPEGLIRNGDYRIDNGLLQVMHKTFVEDAHHI